MEICTRILGDAVILEISGHLTAEEVPLVRTAFSNAFPKYKNVVFDLKNMESLDSTGLGALVSCLKTSKEKNGVLKLAALGNEPKMVFEITQAYRIFSIYDNVEDAVESFKKS